MRPFVAAAAIGLSACCVAQTGLPAHLQGIGRDIAAKGLRFNPLLRPVGGALDPSGFPGLDPQDPRTPPSDVPDDRRLRLLSADKFERKGDVVLLTGKVRCQYQGYDLFADYIEGNLTTEVFVLSGGATAIGPDAVIVGEAIEIDFRNDTYRADNARAQLRPSFMSDRTVDDLYVWGRETRGTARELHTHDGGLTSCNLEHPHFRLLSRDVDVRPGKRVILRNSELRILRHKVLRIPYLSIPLDNRHERYQPEVGRTRDTGYYIKTIWGVPVRGSYDVDAYVDYFEKLGFGLGGRFYYGNSTGEGFVRAYKLGGIRDSLEVTTGIVQDIGNSTLTVDANYQKQNFFNAPENTILTTRAMMIVPHRQGSARFQFSRNTNEGPNFSSVQQTVGVNDQRSFGGRLQTVVDVRWSNNLSTFSTSDPVEREQVDLRLRGQYDLRQAVAELEYLRSIPVGNTDNFFSAADRTPVVSLRTDSQRLFGENWRRYPRINSELSIGEFANSGTQSHIMRTYFDVTVNKPDETRKPVGFGVLARFRQGIYGDDTAQYALALNTNFRLELGTLGTFNLRHNYLKPRGFTPLSIDRIGETDLTSADLGYQPLRNVIFRAGTGYDAIAKKQGAVTGWQPLNLGLDWTPKPEILFRTLATYDPFQELWSNLRFDLAWAGRETYVSLGARYDGSRKVWGNFNFFVDGFRIGRTSITALGQYNGFIRKFEAVQYSLIYDLHCAEAVLQVVENSVGFRPGTEVYFFVRLKAFPFNGGFGTGQRGQPIGTGTGSGF